MSDVLARICADKRARVAQAKAARPYAKVERQAREAPAPRGFIAALGRAVAAGRYGLIAEIKKASPSAGLIRADFAPAELAQAYAAGGATCLSVLTEEDHFSGSPAHLSEAHGTCTLPVLRKDFMLDPYQIAEAREMGADCILLILAALSDAQARELEDAAASFGLDVLVEVHDRAEFARALLLKTRMIGINNRNLRTLKTTLETTEELSKLLPAGRVAVSESGLSSSADLARMAHAGVRNFLIGEALMKQPDVAAATRKLLTEPVGVR